MESSGQAGCVGCARLQAALTLALQQRDEALLALAKERERGQAIYAQWAEPQVAAGPARTAAGAPPAPTQLRYRVVDRLNEEAKRRLGPLHRRARAVAEWLLKGGPRG